MIMRNLLNKYNNFRFVFHSWWTDTIKYYAWNYKVSRWWEEKLNNTPWPNFKKWIKYSVLHLELPKYILVGHHPHCRKCKVPGKYFDDYDVYACMECNQWLERFCKPEPNGKIYFPSPKGLPKDEQ